MKDYYTVAMKMESFARYDMTDFNKIYILPYIGLDSYIDVGYMPYDWHLSNRFKLDIDILRKSLIKDFNGIYLVKDIIFFNKKRRVKKVVEWLNSIMVINELEKN